ncbi:MAG: hypothetical protein Q7T46_03625 [Polaromonas sp.]|nr:hypothetical protein [Polaromonas sp.]
MPRLSAARLKPRLQGPDGQRDNPKVALKVVASQTRQAGYHFAKTTREKNIDAKFRL